MSVDNVGWFMAGAEFMANIRPDLWSLREALHTLGRWKQDLEKHNENDGFISSGGFTLYRSVDSSKGSVSYELKMDVVDLTEYNNGETPFVWLWDDCTKDRVSKSTAELIGIKED